VGNIFFELAIVICLAALITVIFKHLKQPLLLAYILTGIIVGPFGAFHLGSTDFLRTMGELGITLLLFILGLELKISELKSIGKVASIVGFFQIGLTLSLGYLISLFLGFNQITSLYIGIVLTFSSTILVVKLLSDKKDLGSLYGKISVGVLLMQDLFAILTLIFLSGFTSGKIEGISSLYPFGFILLKGFIIFGFVFYLSRSIFPKIIDSIAKSQEALFLVSLAVAFGMAAFVSSPPVGFSVEIGGLLAGLALANSSSSYQIAARTRALRDFFIIIFFIFLGTEMVFSNISQVIIPALILSVFVLVSKPLFTMTIMGFLGYRKRTSFLSGITLAQVSEFSLIVLFLGNKLGHVPQEAISLITIVAIVTFISSNYMIFHGNGLYRSLEKYIKFFERKKTHQEKIDGHDGELDGHVLLIGAHRMGESILDSLEKSKHKVAVVDFNPDIVKGLRNKELISIFGDISDFDIQERANLSKAKLVISTVPDIEDNLNLIKSLNKYNRKAKVIVLGQDTGDAKQLYRAGADYVVLPHLAGGRQVQKILKDGDLSSIEEFKRKDLSYLN